MDVSKPLHANNVSDGTTLDSEKSNPNGKDTRTKEQLEALYKRYKTLNWAYTGEEQTIDIQGLGEYKLRVFPSGAKYIYKNRTTLEKFDDAWFKKMYRLADELERKNAETSPVISNEK